MSQSAPSPWRLRRISRQHAIFVGAAVAVSLFAGIVTAALTPPTATSSAEVAFPAGAVVTPAGSGLAVIAALPKFGPGVPLAISDGSVQVIAVKPDLLWVTAQASTPAQAKAAANWAAQGYIAYDASVGPAGHIPAVMLQSATSASGPAQPMRLLIGALLGLASGVLTGVIAALANRRLAMIRRLIPG